jgi:endonuclease/exonuclease/phosphatase family metal-dependent hydrolase
MRKELLIIGIGLLFSTPVLAQEADDRDGGLVRVMTLNMDEGTDFLEVIAATSPGAFVAAVTTTYQNIQATKPAERAAAMARQIVKERPDFVGLQEASILRTGSTSPATTVQSDLLQLLIGNLAKLGHNYTVAGIVPGLDAEAPSTLGFRVRVTTQDAIIVRADPGADVKLLTAQVQHYLTNLTLATAVGPITVPRGWASVDATVRGRTLRFVTTHLESDRPPTQLAQAKELVRTAGNTSLPIIFAGDFNTTTDAPSDPTFAAYQAIIDAGFADAWPQHTSNPGFTCCQDPLLQNPDSQLTHRIDLLLFRGTFRVAAIHLIGSNPSDLTPSGLWPSDHAGVVATLRVPTAQLATDH